MSHAVLIQNPASIYDDAHGLHYHFPRMYLGILEECVGDWVVFYESRKGAYGYTHVQKVLAIRPDPMDRDHFYADLDPKSALDFEKVVPRTRLDGTRFESRLALKGGNNTLAVRRVSPADFAAIINAGLQEVPDIDAHPRDGPLWQVAEDAATFEHDRRHVLTSRPARDAAFARMVRRAYGGRCAISALRLRNGGGRAEVQACHIRSVKDGGPDVVRNGIALSGTLHWMFDRGLIRVADDHSLLISHNKVDLPTVERLVNPEHRLLLDEVDRRHWPHPDYLRWHREKDYG
ncbi:HNH endonuclease [Jannaschia marina]|uniref:HNH endonuclease n=1 Tax=Jannaschia marina TaxID=2741674 RepID=UPI0015CE979B|nr:HNH endonuclease [Jannaschia marina]